MARSNIIATRKLGYHSFSCRVLSVCPLIQLVSWYTIGGLNGAGMTIIVTEGATVTCMQTGLPVHG